MQQQDTTPPCERAHTHKPHVHTPLCVCVCNNPLSSLCVFGLAAQPELGQQISRHR